MKTETLSALMQPIGGHAVVVFSGGQDSTTCLLWALNTFDTVEAITFAYGQRHAAELTCAKGICRDVGVKQTVIDVSFFGAMSQSALTQDGSVSAKHAMRPDLPASFVPNRNALFLTLAHAYAQTVGAEHLVAGMCQTDFSGYPDCREDFVIGLIDVLNTGGAREVCIHTPLMYLTKAETFSLAAAFDNGLQLVLERSHTCYEGDRSIRHEWGYGCGECPACLLRAKGFDQFCMGA